MHGTTLDSRTLSDCDCKPINHHQSSITVELRCWRDCQVELCWLKLEGTVKICLSYR